MTWGYDSTVVKGVATPVDKSNIFAHARDLLYALDRERPPGRPLIFVTHSLGGIVVKEMLRRSETSEEKSVQDIVESTQAVVFLGTPHRRSAELAALGDVWRHYNFRVKTFQEALGFSGVDIGPLNEKVVPDSSSSLDDLREHAETIHANHMNIVRFTDESDPGYRKVGGEIKRLVGFVVARSKYTNEEITGCMQSLSFRDLGARQHYIKDACENTCNWLFDTSTYRIWYRRQPLSDHCGLFWLRGKPGSGSRP
ncbi:hypothetical protein EPUS_06237 [Endocarpon pusillum Z07020]|uniref:DUF676 domain-containing protein n=1 Tax=Endocarpon pusillum (strain Z07020 / HMAS-L-300199) TaxID=1263415 RepID=U1G9V9_ENDPU|nr:uncharacterized protein EPUS_06237 [Endocarpon pusillum Z07020]ERF68793.1 hypothetical protein EPUS_06237 [Endocarpon pusillum Z07020]